MSVWMKSNCTIIRGGVDILAAIADREDSCCEILE